MDADRPSGGGDVHDRETLPLYNTSHVPMQPSAAAEELSEYEISIVQKMLSAVVGSVLTSLLVTPLDVVRVRLQSQQQPSPTTFTEYRNLPNLSSRSFSNLPPNLGVTACCREVFWVTNNAPFCVATEGAATASLGNSAALGSECAVEETQRKTFNTTLDGLRKIARNEGLTTLWRGLSPTLVMAVPANVIYFTGYDWLRGSRKSPLHGRVSDAYAPLVAGSSARILAALAVSPIELFRTRMQASHASTAAGTFKETLNGVSEMVQTQGYRSLWRGLTLTLWRDLPFSASYWWNYEAIRNVLTDARARSRGEFVDPNASMSRRRSGSRSRENHTVTLIDSFVAGAISGGIASILTMPFDVGKTRQQVLPPTSDFGTSAEKDLTKALRPEDRSMPRFLWHIFKEEGVAGLFKGWAARTLKVAPACAIMISSYEVGKKMAQTSKEARLA